MKYRRVRELLSESMATVVEVEDKAALWEIVRDFSKSWPGYQDATIEDLEVRPYGFDERIGWDTHIVVLKGSAVGYTDGPL